MTCSLPVSHKERVPVMVSLVQEKCEEARNSLKVIYNPLREKEHKQKFAVCSKCLGKVVWSLQFSLYFCFQFNVPSDFPSEDISIKLVEWIEISRALGAAKIFLYKLDVHSNISKVCLGFPLETLVDQTQSE